MEFSQYIIDLLTSINITNHHDTSAISLIRKASENAPSESDSHILGIIAGTATMCYKEKERSFGPFLIWNDGSRSFAPEDIKENDIDILRGVIRITCSTYIRTKFSHIVWLITKDNRYGEIAVDGYLDEFERQFDPDSWVSCYDQIIRAYHISSAMGNKSDSFKRTRVVINGKLSQMNGSDPLFLSLNLLNLVLQNASKEELLKYESIISILADRNFGPTNTKINLADETYTVIEKLYVRMNKAKELKTIKSRYANYYETRAKALAHDNDYFNAVILLKKACNLYSGIDQVKLLELRQLLEGWQKIALQRMHVQKHEFNVQPIYDEVVQMFEGLSLSEAIVQFGRVVKIYKVDDVKKELLEKPEQYVLSSMIGSSLLNERGQSVQELPPIKDAIDSGDPIAIKKHMIHYAAEQRRLIGVLFVKIAYQCLEKYGPIKEDDLNFLVIDNGIIPDNREEIIKQGLCLGLNGKLYAAMHILQPQTENIFRNLVKMCGDTVTFLKDDGSEEYKPLSSLFKSDKLLDCYNEDIIFTFQSIMDDPTGENLRNLTGHGLLDPEVGNSMISLYFLSLLIFLLSLYGIKPYSILIDLDKQTDKQDNGDE